MDKQVVFKTSAFGGFEKKAVLDYIYKLNESAEEAQANLQARLNEEIAAREAAEKDFMQLRGEMGSLAGENEAAQIEIREARQNLEELADNVARLNAEIEKQDDIITQKETEIRDYVRQFNQLSTRNAELEKKQAEVNNASARLGDLMMNAHSEAAGIVDAAKSKASAVMASAEASARLKIDSTQKAVESAYERLSAFRTEISNIQRVVLDSLEAMHAKAADISSVIDSAQESLHNIGHAPANALYETETVFGTSAMKFEDGDTSADKSVVYEYPTFETAFKGEEAYQPDSEDFPETAPALEDDGAAPEGGDDSRSDDGVLAKLKAFLEENTGSEDNASDGQQDQADSQPDESKRRFLNMLRGWIN